MDTDETKISLLENHIFKKKSKQRVKLQKKMEIKDMGQEDKFRSPCRCILDGKHEWMKDREKNKPVIKKIFFP